MVFVRSFKKLKIVKAVFVVLRPMVCVAALGSTMGCASAAPEPTTQQAAAIDAICDKVMKLWPGAQFQACQSSLADTVTAMVQADYTAAAYKACGQSGQELNRTELARCILDHRETAINIGSPPAGSVSKLSAATIEPVASDRDFYMDGSIPVRRRRERYACAELGLAPGVGLFGACTDELETQIYFVDHPNG
ncbi:MAG TPA: hypothetical protein VN723_13035 [Rhizomicrobium sp.]|nr:hypothetical protein [Rhizomicrobium sp.]